LRDGCLSWLPPSALMLLPDPSDGLTHAAATLALAYLRISKAIAGPRFTGIWFSSQRPLPWAAHWALAPTRNGAPWLARTPAIGRFRSWSPIETRACGRRGRLSSMSPGPCYVGTLTCEWRTGRFAAAINQAPLCAGRRKPWLAPYDRRERAAHVAYTLQPPDHLRGGVRDPAAIFGRSERRRETVPIARPVILHATCRCERGDRC